MRSLEKGDPLCSDAGPAWGTNSQPGSHARYLLAESVQANDINERTPMLNTRQIQLIQETFDLIPIDASAMAALFYQRLFELDPNLRTLFKDDITIQGAKFMRTLSVLIWGLHQSEKFMPIARELGKQHQELGVPHDSYEPVGEALLWTLQQILDDRFTPEVETAWIAAYDLLAKIMQDAAVQTEETE